MRRNHQVVHPKFPPKVCVLFKMMTWEATLKGSSLSFFLDEFYKLWRTLVIYSETHRGSESICHRVSLKDS